MLTSKSGIGREASTCPVLLAQEGGIPFALCWSHSLLPRFWESGRSQVLLWTENYELEPS